MFELGSTEWWVLLAVVYILSLAAVYIHVKIDD